MRVYENMAEVEMEGFTVDALDQPRYRKMKRSQRGTGTWTSS